MKAYGPGMPPRNPAAEAERTRREYRRHMLAAHLQRNGHALVAGALDVVRTAGAVLLVLQLHHLTPAPVWLAIAMAFAPNLASVGMLLARYWWSRYVAWRVAREVR